jgi:hypothetical protein
VGPPHDALPAARLRPLVQEYGYRSNCARLLALLAGIVHDSLQISMQPAVEDQCQLKDAVVIPSDGGMEITFMAFVTGYVYVYMY